VNVCSLTGDQLTSMGEAECPESEVRRCVRDAAQAELNCVYCLMDEHFTGNEFLHQTNSLANTHSSGKSHLPQQQFVHRHICHKEASTHGEQNKVGAISAFTLLVGVEWHSVCKN